MVSAVLIDKELTRVLIAEQGKNLSDFAIYIGISKTYLSQILNGDRNPSPTTAYKIAQGLDLKIDDLFLINVADRPIVNK